MINFTEMCKPFGKRPVDFLKLEQTKAFLQKLTKSLNFNVVKKNHNDKIQLVTQLVHTSHGGVLPQGTWIHRKVAIKAAAWLSPAFEVWMIEQIETLLTQGSVRLSNRLVASLKNRKLSFSRKVKQKMT